MQVAGDAFLLFFRHLQQAPAEQLVFLLQAVGFKGAVQGYPQGVFPPWLEHVLIDVAPVDGVDDIVGVGVAGEDDADGVRVVSAQPLQQFDAAHPRHALVGDDDGDIVLVPEDLQRLVAGGGGEYRKLILEDHGKVGEVDRFVVDVEEFDGCAGGGVWFCWKRYVMRHGFPIAARGLTSRQRPVLCRLAVPVARAAG